MVRLTELRLMQVLKGVLQSTFLSVLQEGATSSHMPVQSWNSGWTSCLSIACQSSNVTRFLWTFWTALFGTVQGAYSAARSLNLQKVELYIHVGKDLPCMDQPLLEQRVKRKEGYQLWEISGMMNCTGLDNADENQEESKKILDWMELATKLGSWMHDIHLVLVFGSPRANWVAAGHVLWQALLAWDHCTASISTSSCPLPWLHQWTQQHYLRKPNWCAGLPDRCE